MMSAVKPEDLQLHVPFVLISSPFILVSLHPSHHLSQSAGWHDAKSYKILELI